MVERRDSAEASVREGGSCRGADLYLLELSREQFRRQLHSANEKADDAEANLRDARTRHVESLGRRRTAVKVDERIRKERGDDIERKHTRTLEELSRSHWLAGERRGD